MVSYTYEVTLDINTNTAYSVVPAKQGDTGSRWLLIHLTEDNIPYNANPVNNAQFRCRKPDGHAIINPAIINNDGTIGVELTAQTLAVAGRAYADVVETDTEGNVLSTVAFILLIMAAPNVAANAVSSDEFSKLNELVSRADQLITEAEGWARGTENGVDIGPAEYEEDETVTANNFELKKNSLYIKNDNNEYVAVAADADFNDELTYYLVTVGDNNNAKYYSECAESAHTAIKNLSVSIETKDAGTNAEIEKETINNIEITHSRQFEVYVNSATFATQINENIGIYVFVYKSDYNSWLLNGNSVNLSDYGISTYIEDDTVTENNFTTKKASLYIKNENNEYTSLSSNSTYNSQETYYILYSSFIDGDLIKIDYTQHGNFTFKIPRGDTGNVNFMTFEINPVDGILYSYASNSFSDIEFNIDEEGYLAVDLIPED